MQTTYDRYMGVAVPGLIADSEFTTKDGLQAAEAVGLGLAVVQKIGSPNQGRLPKVNKSTIVFAGDLITDNVVNMKVNGVAMAPVTFTTNHLTTMGLIVTALKAVAGVAASTALDATDTNNRTILLYVTDGLDALVTDIVVTLGVSQTTGTATVSSVDTIYGVSIFSQAIEQPYPSTGAIVYQNGNPVGCLLRGRIWVRAETVVTNGDAVYMRVKDGGAGKAVGQFRNDSDSGTAKLVPGMIWRSVTTATAQLALVDINQPQ